MKVVAVVPTYNRLDELKLTLTRLLAEPLEAIVVVDNGSTDGTYDWLARQKDPRLALYRSDNNLGGAGGFSVGMQAAHLQFKPDWFLLMDDDARPQPGAIDAFHQSSHGYDIISAAVYGPDGSICEMNRPSCNPFWNIRDWLRTAISALFGRGRAGFHITDRTYSQAHVKPIDVGSFVGMFISAKAYQHIGVPDRRLFIYGDDVCYSLLARLRGLRIGFAPLVRFDHNCEAAIHSNEIGPLWKRYYGMRNGIFSYKLAAGMWFWALIPFFILKWYVQGWAYGTDRDAYFRVFRQAIWDGFNRRLDISHAEILRLTKSIPGKS